MSLLEVSGLHAAYGPVRVLHGLDFVVDDSEIVVILGANGAGKTTTLRSLSGTIPVVGEVRFGGTSIAGRKPEDIVRLGMAHVPQGRGTFMDLSVDENLRLGGYTRPESEVAQDKAHWYEVFPRLAERRTQAAGSMSGGEQQMLAVARALMCRPRLLLCDEPSLGLAPLVVRELFERLAEVNQRSGTAILLVEQNANLALEIASRAYVLENGSIVMSGTADELSEDEAIRRAYLGM